MDNPLHRRRVRNRFLQMRKRLPPLVVNANSACFIHGGWLASNYLPAPGPPEDAELHGLKQMQGAFGLPFVGTVLLSLSPLRGKVIARGRR